jgi:NADPH:quinone reductase-like Zn-dependent oxidoreductase
MKAAWRDRYGTPDVVRIEDLPRPTPTDDQVLVKVQAASVNRADLDALYARWAFVRLFLGLRAPRNRRLGIDVAGVVETVGPTADRFKPGDEVFADLFSFGQDAFSEYVCAPERAFAILPEGLSFEEAATLPHAAILALNGLRRRDGRTFKRGDAVMIVGASGSVGPFAIQLAKARGAHVTGVAGTSKLDFVRSLGADDVIDYTTTDVTATGRTFDWILDVNAHDPVLRWRRSVRPGGVYTALGGDSAWWFASALIEGPAVSLATRRHMGLSLSWKPFNAPDVEAIKQFVAEGTLKPAIDRRFSLEEIVEALRYVDEGHAQGKVIVIP